MIHRPKIAISIVMPTFVGPIRMARILTSIQSRQRLMMEAVCSQSS